MWAHVALGPLMVDAPPDTTTTEPPPTWTASSMIIVAWQQGVYQGVYQGLPRFLAIRYMILIWYLYDTYMILI